MATASVPSILDLYTFSIPPSQNNVPEQEKGHDLLLRAQGNENNAALEAWMNRNSCWINYPSTRHAVSILAIAVLKRNQWAVAFLLNKHADPFDVDAHMQTPWSLAQAVRDPAISQIFEKYIRLHALQIPRSESELFAHTLQSYRKQQLFLAFSQSAVTASAEQASRYLTKSSELEKANRGQLVEIANLKARILALEAEVAELQVAKDKRSVKRKKPTAKPSDSSSAPLERPKSSSLAPQMAPAAASTPPQGMSAPRIPLPLPARILEGLPPPARLSDIQYFPANPYMFSAMPPSATAHAPFAPPPRDLSFILTPPPMNRPMVPIDRSKQSSQLPDLSLLERLQGPPVGSLSSPRNTGSFAQGDPSELHARHELHTPYLTLASTPTREMQERLRALNDPFFGFNTE